MAPVLHRLAARAHEVAIARMPVIHRDETSGLEPVRRLAARGSDSDSDDGSDNMINALIAVLSIAFFALILISALFLFRRVRRNREARNADTLPVYSQTPKDSMQNGLTIETKHNGRSSVVFIGRDGQPMLQNPSSPPHSPDNVPEIHITFPDEQDDEGQRKSGRVLIVRVGDNATVGLEPVQEEQLPAYEKEAKGQFQSLDMEQLGGLKEKDRNMFQ
jgi:preprotein translocase subunit SecG